MSKQKTILVTGGAGFIGSAVIRRIIRDTDYRVINVDKLTYAGNLDSLAEALSDPRHIFEQVDICDTAELFRLFNQYRPSAVLHLAAESHVDRSIDGPAVFINTNIVGTYNLLEAARRYWLELPHDAQLAFRFQHVSTDEVFGSLGPTGLFDEQSRYQPNSPYSASKAASDHLVRAWHHTYGLPVIATNCSNNYGPYQFPEKLIPLCILNAAKGEPLSVYGDGKQVRDWLYVEDHAHALIRVLEQGKVGEVYNIGGHNEQRNIDVVNAICLLLDELTPIRPAGLGSYSDLIRFVKDRPGHDLRYAIDASKMKKDLAWTPQETFGTGLRKTVEWYLNNSAWCEGVNSRAEQLKIAMER